MNIWKLDNWKSTYENVNVRTGLRLRCDRDVNSEVRRACKEFCKWLRAEYEFPIRVPIYLKASPKIKAKDGDMVNSIFWGPANTYEEPYIKMAVGNYDKILKKWGKDNALASYLLDIAVELTCYYQWLNDIELTKRGLKIQAGIYGNRIVDEYAETREHP